MGLSRGRRWWRTSRFDRKQSNWLSPSACTMHSTRYLCHGRWARENKFNAKEPYGKPITKLNIFLAVLDWKWFGYNSSRCWNRTNTFENATPNHRIFCLFCKRGENINMQSIYLLVFQPIIIWYRWWDKDRCACAVYVIGRSGKIVYIDSRRPDGRTFSYRQ